MSASELEELARFLHGLLANWKELTLAEASAIQQENWVHLKDLQKQKQAVQQAIEDSEHRLFESPSLTDREKNRQREQIKKIANELLALEQKNQEALAKQMTETDIELKDSNRAISSLRYIQKAYGKGGKSFWQAYS